MKVQLTDSPRPALVHNLSLENLIFDEDVYQFSPEDFQWHLTKWVTEGWPVQFLVRDHYGAKVFYDNGVFSLMEFYGHEWKWDDENGLSILFRANLEDERSEYTNW